MKNNVIMTNMVMAESIAMTFVTDDIPIDDLIGEAYLSLVDSATLDDITSEDIAAKITSTLQTVIDTNANAIHTESFDGNEEIGYDIAPDWRNVAINAAFSSLPERTQTIMYYLMSETPPKYVELGKMFGITGQRIKQIFDKGFRIIVNTLERTRCIPERNDNIIINHTAAINGVKSILEQKIAYLAAPYSNYNARWPGYERMRPLEIVPYVKNDKLGIIPEQKPKPKKVEQSPEYIIKKDANQFFGIMNLQFTKSPTEQKQLAAIKQNGMAIEFVTNPSLEMQTAAVRQTGMAIAFINNPSDYILQLAVKQFDNRSEVPSQ